MGGTGHPDTPGVNAVPPTASPDSQRLRRLCWLPAVALALLLGAPSVRYGFVQDDHFLIPGNVQLRSLASLPTIFATPYSHYAGLEGQTFDWRPLPIATFCLEWQCVGDQPWLYHFDNVLLHALASALVALLALRLSADPRVAAFAGAWYAVMPVHVDNIASVTERSGLLAAVLTLLALLLHGRQSQFLRLASGVALFLALLSKESSVVAPALLVLIDLRERPMPSGTSLRCWLARYAPVLAAVAFWLLLRQAVVGALSYDARLTYFRDEAWTAIAPTMGRFFWVAYAGPSFFAWHRSSDYSFRSFPTRTPDDVLGWFALASVFVAACWFARTFLRTRSLCALGGLWFLGTLLPVANLLTRLLILGAERLLYLPSVGVALIFGAFAPAAARSRPGRVLLALLFAWSLLQSLAGLAVWRHERAYYGGILDSCPDNVLALVGRAGLARTEADVPAALADAERAVTVAPRAPEMRYTLAWILVRAGFPFHAECAVRQALTLDGTTRHKGLLLLAQALEAQGREPEALARYQDVLALRPHWVAALRDLARLRILRKDWNEAASALTDARALAPDSTELAALEAVVLAFTHQAVLAGQRLEEAPLRTAPTHHRLAVQAAIALAEGDIQASRARIRQGLAAHADAPLLHWLHAQVAVPSDPLAPEDVTPLAWRPGGSAQVRLRALPAGERQQIEQRETSRVVSLAPPGPECDTLSQQLLKHMAQRPPDDAERR